MHPTLLIGLGGTGTQVAGRIKEYLQDAGPVAAPPERYRVLCVDTELYPTHPNIESNEYCFVGKVPAPSIVARELENSSEFREWWPPAYVPNLPTFTKGCGMVRLNGKLSHYWMFHDQVATRVEQAIKNLSHLVTTGGMASLEVYISAILSNGTGSGMFLDVAQSVRHIAAAHNIPATVYGIFLCPSVVAMHHPARLNQDRAARNGVAALTELQFWNHRAVEEKIPFAYRYNNWEHLTDRKVPYQPYDLTFLIQGQNKDNAVLGFQEFLDIAARGVAAVCSSNVDARIVDGIGNLTNEERFGSFGYAEVIFPIREVIDYCCVQFAREMLALACDPDLTASGEIRESGSLDAEVQDFLLRDCQLVERGADQIFDRFAPASKTFDRFIKEWQPMVEEAPEGEWQNRFENFEREYSRRLERMREDVRELAQTTLSESRDQVESHVHGLLTRGAAGAALEWVETMEREVSENRRDVYESDYMVKVLEPTKKPRFDSTRDRLREEITEGFEAFWFPARKAAPFLAAYYDRYMKRRARWDRDTELTDQVLRVYDQLLAYLREQRTALEWLVREVLVRVREHFDEAGAALLQNDMDSPTNHKRSGQYTLAIKVGAVRSIVDAKVYRSVMEDLGYRPVTGLTSMGQLLRDQHQRILEDVRTGDAGASTLADLEHKLSYRKLAEEAAKDVGRGLFERKVSTQFGVESALEWEAEYLLRSLWNARESGVQEDLEAAKGRLQRILGRTDADQVSQLDYQDEDDREEAMAQVCASRIRRAVAYAQPFWVPAAEVLTDKEYRIVYHSRAERLASWLKRLGREFQTLPGDVDKLRHTIQLVASEYRIHPGKLKLLQNLRGEYERAMANGDHIHTDRRFARGGEWEHTLWPIEGGELERVDVTFALAVDVEDACEEDRFIGEVSGGAWQLRVPLEDYAPPEGLGVDRASAVERLRGDRRLRDQLWKRVHSKMLKRSAHGGVMAVLEWLTQVRNSLNSGAASSTGEAARELFRRQGSAMNTYIRQYEMDRAGELEQQRMRSS